MNKAREISENYQENDIDGVHNAIYNLNKASNNLLMNKIKEISWTDKIASLQIKLEEICNEHGKRESRINTYHVNQALIHVEKTFFLPLVKISQLDKISNQDRVTMNYLTNQLGYIEEYIPIMLNVSEDCIFSKPQDHECWNQINQNVQIIQIDSKENIQKGIDKLEKTFHFGLAYFCLGEEQKESNIFLRLFKQHYGIAKCIFNQNYATQHALQTFTSPKIEFALKLVGSTDNNLVKQSMNLFLLPKINFHLELYIPRLFEPLTITKIQEEVNQPFTKISPPKLVQDNIPLNLTTPHFQAVQVRLLSSQKNILRGLVDQNHLSSVVDSIKQGKPLEVRSNGDITIKKIVLHIHGGGWISTSSFFHQNYTRKWANYLGDDTLVISCDYRLAPEYTYPFALDDCWQVYLWIVNFASVYLKTNLEQIIITGDSAGGNMAMGVTYRAIKQNVRKPDGIFLPYPAITLNFKRYTPSTLKGIVDTMTPFSMIKLALDAYMNIQGVQPEFDPYLSPAIACDEYLKELPNLVIICGSDDSLKDEMIKFIYRLIQLKEQGKMSTVVKMKIYDGFPHGYLNYDFPGTPIPQVRQLVDDSSRILEELFQTK